MELVEKTYDVKGAAKFLKCSEWKLRKLVKDGEIPYYKIGNRIRFTDLTLTKWMQNQEKKNSHFRA